LAAAARCGRRCSGDPAVLEAQAMSLFNRFRRRPPFLICLLLSLWLLPAGAQAAGTSAGPAEVRAAGGASPQRLAGLAHTALLDLSAGIGKWATDPGDRSDPEAGAPAQAAAARRGLSDGGGPLRRSAGVGISAAPCFQARAPPAA
jgi:hypothetical protein